LILTKKTFFDRFTHSLPFQWISQGLALATYAGLSHARSQNG